MHSWELVLMKFLKFLLLFYKLKSLNIFLIGFKIFAFIKKKKTVQDLEIFNQSMFII